MIKTVRIFAAAALAVLLAASAACGRGGAAENDENAGKSPQADTASLPGATSGDPGTDGEPSAEEKTGTEAPTETAVYISTDPAEVLEMYTKAMNNVKLRCPGFVRTETQLVESVDTGGDRAAAAKIMNLAAVALLRSWGDGSARTEVAAHNDVQVMNKFPLYGQPVGCWLTDPSLLSAAVCSSDGQTDRMFLRVKPCRNPEAGTSAFGGIVLPAARNTAARELARDLDLPAADAFTMDLDYTENEIVCVTDRQTGRMRSLTVRTVIRVDIVPLPRAVLLLSAPPEAHGAVAHTVSFTDFDWS